MAEVTSGFRKILSFSFFYDYFQNFLGANKFREYIVKYYIKPNEKIRILDLGCGTAKILNYLPTSTKYVGFDINKNYIDSAKNCFKNNAIFYYGKEINDLDNKNLKPFDIILAIGLLHHLNDTELKNLFKFSSKHLKSKGRLISVDACFTKNQSFFSRFITSLDRGQNIRFPNGYKNLAEKFFFKIKGDILHKTLLPYTHWIMQCEKK